MGILATILIGFLAGVIAKLLHSGPWSPYSPVCVGNGRSARRAAHLETGAVSPVLPEDK